MMSNAEKNIRAFLAVEPPEEILQAVIRLQEKLKREISGKLSWTRPGGQHLTLKFFGDVSAEEVDSIGQSVRNCLQPGWALNLKIEKLGVFPDARKPRVLWCGTSGDVEKLAALQKQLEADFALIGFPQEDRPFRAHLTLARIRDSREVSGVSEALTRHAAFSAGEFIVKELVLFQSRLTPQGAIYNRLAMFPLAG
ncbi:MAG: RNA 2',3'-cyclic phosphodiesterase [Smithellaceae bacterium]|nr:RNA 2',3'-cyclic phosphodiesterase [Smithellaceae bacterium]